MKSILKSKKALSPVVAAIILIAVTVAVSIAVAAWMGALTFTFMKTDQFNVNSMMFGGVSPNQYINMTLQNTGTSPWTLSSTGQVNGKTVSGITAWTGYKLTVGAGNLTIVKIPYTWTNGNSYSVQLQTTGGTKITYVQNAPTGT
jgi:flagellin-like protein